MSSEKEEATDAQQPTADLSILRTQVGRIQARTALQPRVGRMAVQVMVSQSAFYIVARLRCLNVLDLHCTHTRAVTGALLRGFELSFPFLLESMSNHLKSRWGALQNPTSGFPQPTRRTSSTTSLKPSSLGIATHARKARSLTLLQIARINHGRSTSKMSRVI